VDYILITHIHLDHSGGIGGVMKLLPNAKCVVHERGVFHLAHPAKLWKSSLKTLGKVAEDYGEPEAVPEERLITAKEGMIIDLGNMKFETLITPGHAPHHISFIDRRSGKLFPGEAAGVYFPAFDMARPASPPPFDLKQSLITADKLISAQPKEIYFQHFGYSPDAMLRLQYFKKQLIVWANAIAPHLDEDPRSLLDIVFAADGTKGKVDHLPADHRELELYFVGNNIIGFAEYLKREGTEILKELPLL
jgi:glyoxylase-like metal-dependent hydrolase (beta-lactamase superfamily II)